jgi:hypothetical protein
MARVVWTKNSAQWNYPQTDLNRAAEMFTIHNYVSVVLHVYRYRILYAPGDPACADLETQLLKQSNIPVSAVTLDKHVDGNFPRQMDRLQLFISLARVSTIVRLVPATICHRRGRMLLLILCLKLPASSKISLLMTIQHERL